ncbi:MAG: hypothetical protein WCG04_06420 [Alphaproteobacteria bacterium]
MSDKFNIDKEAITQLAEILEDTGLLEIEYEDSGRRVRVVRNMQQQMPMFMQHTPPPIAPLVVEKEVPLQSNP